MPVLTMYSESYIARFDVLITVFYRMLRYIRRHILLIRIFLEISHTLNSMYIIISSQSTQGVVVGATENGLSNGKVGISNDEIILTLNLLNFFNGIIHLPFLELSIIIFREIKMKT